jgi:hypothetical protein
MNNAELANIDGEFEPPAAEILQNIPGFEVNPHPRGKSTSPDAILRFNGGQAALLIEFKSRVNVATAPQLVNQLVSYADSMPGARRAPSRLPV